MDSLDTMRPPFDLPVDGGLRLAVQKNSGVARKVIDRWFGCIDFTAAPDPPCHLIRSDPRRL
jgi:hypothetical protein